MDNYPDEADLKRITEWPMKSEEEFEQVMEFVKRIWHWDFVVKEGGAWRLATGGWSGNEDIISAMMQNFMLLAMAWQSSHRGGLHWFAWPVRDQKDPGDKP